MSDQLRDFLKDEFSKIHARFEQLDQRFALMDKRFDQMDQRFETMAKHSDLLAMRETLETIANKSASKVEDKAEAGYVVLESLFKGLEDRIAKHISDIVDKVNDIVDEINDAFELVYEENSEIITKLQSNYELTKEIAEELGHQADNILGWARFQHEIDREFEVVKNDLEQLKKEVEKLSGE